MSDPKPRTLGAILYPQFELLDLYGPLEMFGCLGPALRIVTVAEQAGPVASTPGPCTVAEHSFASAPPLDLLLVPGGFGTFPQLENKEMLGFLRERAPRAEVAMSVCTGAALYAAAGLLDGRRATTNKQFFSMTCASGPKTDWVKEARWVEDGKMVTSSGVSAGTDMALAVIAKLWGASAAQQVAEITEYEWQRDPARDPFARFLDHARIAVEGLA
ncbi:MAG: DJ-1/PfpI family protein [Myxococcota bacterium]|jgi:transcriptional regulator GlxA family with amidase domain